MSNIKPQTKIKKLFSLKEQVVQGMCEMCTRLSNDADDYNKSYTLNPQKNTMIHFSVYSGVEKMSFALEFEYKGTLLIFFYKPSRSNDVEYCFAYEWHDDEIESGSDAIFVPDDIEEGMLFQQSLIDDLHFLTIDIHTELIRFCREVHKEVLHALGYETSN